MKNSYKSLQKTLIAVLIGYTASPAFSQVDPELDALLIQRTDSMHEQLNNMSLSAAITFSDGTTWKYANGNSGLFQPATTNQVYGIGSVTKTLTAACILQLADAQQLSLDDSIHEWLPAIPNMNPDVTIRQLLSHRSGLNDLFANPQLQPTLLNDPDSVWSSEDLFETFLQTPLGQPGANWNYCNSNYHVLGMIVEAVTGNDFYDEISTRFLNPLNLTSFQTSAFETLSSPVCHVWLDITGDNIIDDAHSFFFNWLSINSAAGPAGAYYATAEDVSKWMHAYQSGTLLSPAMMNEAQTTFFAPGTPATYGLGIMKRSYLGYESYGHGGDISYSATSWYFPELDISISVMNNDSRITSWELAPVIAALLDGYLNWQTAGLAAYSEPTLIVSPNPFTENDALNISGIPTHQIKSCNLFSTDGKEVVISTELETLSEQAKYLKAGTYLLEIRTANNDLITKRIIKQ